jgi:carbon-monoxide dehydrogenase catalytic subunit
MSEKAIAIGCYFVASGVDVILGRPFHIGGLENVTRFLSEESRELFGASFHVCADPHEAVAQILDLIRRKRERLGLHRQAQRQLYDMKGRRALEG